LPSATAEAARSGETSAPGACLVIGNGFEVVGAGEEGPQFGIDAPIVLGQALEFRLHTVVGFGDLGETLEDKSLSDMKPGEVGGASGILVEADPEHGVGVGEELLGLFKEAGRFRGHRVSPSRLISCMSGVRSR
jgi:hypothetical protein